MIQAIARGTLLATTLALSASAAYAQSLDDVYLGGPVLGGTGCPQGTASAVLSPDAKSLSILFDSYIAEAGGYSGKRMDRKSCNVAIPVHVPSGYSVSILQVDYRGFNDLPYGATSEFQVEYFFAGTQGPRYAKTFYGQQAQDFQISNPLIASAQSWSACGEDVNLRTNSSVRVTTNAYGEAATSMVDSIDVSAGIIYQLQWRRCGSGSPAGGGIAPAPGGGYGQPGYGQPGGDDGGRYTSPSRPVHPGYRPAPQPSNPTYRPVPGHPRRSSPPRGPIVPPTRRGA